MEVARVERPPQSRGDRSGEVGAEAGNVVASIGRIDEKEIHLLFDYSHKAYDCEAIRLHYNNHHADKSPETPPVERPSHRNKKRANKIALFEVEVARVELASKQGARRLSTRLVIT